MSERAVVGEQERARRVRVQTSDRHDAPLVAHEPDDRRPPVRVAGGRDHARGLVQEHVRRRLRLDGLPVHLDAVARVDVGGQTGRLAVHAHAPGPDELLDRAARAQARAGEVGVQAHAPIMPPRDMSRGLSP